jgi:hypothetical protein
LVSEERSYFVSREISRGCPAHNWSSKPWLVVPLCSVWKIFLF